MAQAPTQGEGNEAERLFGEWVARLPAPTSAGEDDDFAAFCAQHADHAPMLRRLHADWRHVAGLLDRLGLTISVAPGGTDRTTDANAPHSPGAQGGHDRYGSGVDPGVTLQRERAASSTSDFSAEILARLSSRPDASGRYRIQGEVDRGGQGVILRVWDEDLRRHLAMKVTLGRVRPSTAMAAAAAAEPSQAATTPPIDVRSVGRFLEEAQVTGQLDHPGIVPVHELGLDAQGRVFFTMKLVKGDDLRTIFARVHAGDEDWTITRVLSLLMKVCEAMSYAHAKGVIHRDLKPSNIMVGRYGEVFVMDWGLARVLGQPDDKDIRVRPPALAATSQLQSERHERAAADPNSPLITMDGDVVGTPAFMSPEQAKGMLDLMGPPSDVYSLGAMLYQLLTGRIPYVMPDARVNNYAILSRVQEGPPPSAHALAPEAPAELVAICEQAMAREPAARYADMSAVAEDLRAYLEGRVVGAHRPSPGFRIYNAWRVQHRNTKLGVGIAYLFLAAALFALVMGRISPALLAMLLGFTYFGIGLATTGIVLRRAKWLFPLLLLCLPTFAAIYFTPGLLAMLDAERGFMELDLAPEATRLRMIEEEERTALESEDRYYYWRSAQNLVVMNQPERALALLEQMPADLEWSGMTVRAKALHADLLQRAGREHEALGVLDQLVEEYRRHLLMELDNELVWRRDTLAIREGAASPASVDVPLSAQQRDADNLNNMAWILVDPERSTFGREAEGLALARLAFSKTPTSAAVGDTLAWALFANGLDHDAIVAGEAALQSATDDKKAIFVEQLRKLNALVDDFSPERERNIIATLEARHAALEAELARK